MCECGHARGSGRTTFETMFSAPTGGCGIQIELTSSGLYNKHLYPLGHHAGLCLATSNVNICTQTFVQLKVR